MNHFYLFKPTMILREVFYDPCNEEPVVLKDGDYCRPILTPLGLPKMCRLLKNGLPLRSSNGIEGVLERVVKHNFCGIPRSPRFEYGYGVDRELIQKIESDPFYYNRAIFVPVPFFRIEGYKDEERKTHQPFHSLTRSRIKIYYTSITNV